MITCALFAEDDGHRALLVPLIERISSTEGADVDIHVRNAERGKGRAISSLKRYVRDVQMGVDQFAQILVVAIDGNCHGLQAKRRQLRDLVADGFPGRLVLAVPDPHVERWYLADERVVSHIFDGDSAANVPPTKCERGLYKAAVRAAFLEFDVELLTGGAEYGSVIAERMDLQRACNQCESLAVFIEELRGEVRVLNSSAGAAGEPDG